jgi:hypothetical protein
MMRETHPVAIASAHGADQRRSPRLEIMGTLSGHVVSVNRRVELRDLSFGGFAAETEDPFTPGSIHKFRFTTQDAGTAELWARTVHCRAKVASNGSPVYAIGFEFLYQGSRAVRDAINVLIDAATGDMTFS